MKYLDMVNSLFNKILLFLAGIAVLALMLLATGSPVQAKGYSPPGPLPGIESTLQVCRDEVLRLGHGTIEGSHTVERNGHRVHVFFTRDQNGVDWLVACGSTDGKIVQAVGLDRI